MMIVKMMMMIIIIIIIVIIIVISLELYPFYCCFSQWIPRGCKFGNTDRAFSVIFSHSSPFQPFSVIFSQSFSFQSFSVFFSLFSHFQSFSVLFSLSAFSNCFFVFLFCKFWLICGREMFSFSISAISSHMSRCRKSTFNESSVTYICVYIVSCCVLLACVYS